MDRYLDQLVKSLPIAKKVNRIIAGRSQQLVEAEVSIGSFQWTHLIGENKIVVHLDWTRVFPITVSVDFDRRGTDGASIILEGPSPDSVALWSAHCQNLIPETPGFKTASVLAERFRLAERKGARIVCGNGCCLNDTAAEAMLTEIVKTLRSSLAKNGRRLRVVKIL